MNSVLQFWTFRMLFHETFLYLVSTDQVMSQCFCEHFAIHSTCVDVKWITCQNKIDPFVETMETMASMCITQTGASTDKFQLEVCDIVRTGIWLVSRNIWVFDDPLFQIKYQSLFFIYEWKILIDNIMWCWNQTYRSGTQKSPNLKSLYYSFQDY